MLAAPRWQEPLRQRAQTACEAAIRYAQCRDFAGYDKHDALNSPPLRALSGNHRLLRLALTQAVMRAPWNLRPLLGIPRTRNPKGAALFAMSCLDLFRATHDQQWRDQALALLDWLRTVACRTLTGCAWGYPYPWQDVGFFAPSHLPNRVVTCFVAQAFLAAYETLGREEDAALCGEICEFLLRNPKRLYESDDMLCLSYVPSEEIEWVVLDVSALAGAILARTAAINGHSELRAEAERLVRYVVDKQTDYGAWYYSHPPNASPITHDNYHTGFILDAILDYSQATGDQQFLPAYQTGLRFYAERLFTQDGAPKWRHDRTYPHDVHGAAQGILTFTRAAALEKKWAAKAECILAWPLDHLFDAQGFFYYQQQRWYTKKFCLLRWGNAWMARALGAYLSPPVSLRTPLAPNQFPFVGKSESMAGEGT